MNLDSFNYDKAGQVLREGNAIAGSNGQTAGSAAVRKDLIYTRYPSGEVSSLIYPSGFTAQRSYTARGQLQDVTWNGGIVRYYYLKDGKVDYYDYGNGVRNDLDYDGRGFTKLTNSFRLSPSQPYTRRDYWRDSRDRITAWKKTETGRGDRYSYDAEGQLTNVSCQALTPEATPTGALRGDNFTYDALGNRQGWNYLASRGWMNFTRRDNGLNQYWSWENNIPATGPGHWGSAIYHDDNSPWAPWNAFPGNGVTMADGWLVASYNALNQPVAMIPYGSANVFYFGYDPLGRCVKRWAGSSSTAGSNPATYLYYDGWSLVQEGTSAASPTRLYVHGNRVDEIVASLTGGAWNYHHYDARGHCILLTGPSGNVIEQYEYDAFGQPYFYNAGGGVLNGSSYGNRFLFTGREWLSDLKLYDYRARMYQPELGRFLQPDPKQFAAGDYNLYRYCHNDPVNKSDPFGLELDAVYSIGSQTLTVTNLDNGQKIVVSANSGSNKLSEVGLSDRGPVPLGNYSMYDRGADKNGASRYILDPNDSRPNNDTLDGKPNEEGGGRYAFRLHAEDANAPQKGSEGCVVVGRDKLGKIDKMASDTTKGPKATIVSEGRKPGERTDVFRDKEKIGTLRVTK